VIIATLNEAANIEHVMDTALADDLVIELIISDGGSRVPRSSCGSPQTRRTGPARVLGSPSLPSLCSVCLTRGGERPSEAVGLRGFPLVFHVIRETFRDGWSLRVSCWSR
jgi:hypothetical protein